MQTNTHTHTQRDSLTALLRRELFEKDAGLKVNEQASKREREGEGEGQSKSATLCASLRSRAREQSNKN